MRGCVAREAGVKNSPAWDRYEVWNCALSDVVFNATNAGHSVYLDMDDDVLGRVAAEAGVEPSEATSQLVAAVRDTLNLSSASGPVFAQHIRRLNVWRRSLKDTAPEAHQPPPVLALLAVLTLAAEDMGRDADFGANAYYPRLFQLLSIDDPGQRRRLQSSYMHEAEAL